MMKSIQKIGIHLVVLLFGLTLSAQQQAQFSQYMYNTANINPAYAGSRDVLSIIGLYRTQWVGLEGAPKTATFAINTPAFDKVGLGFSAINDKIGPSETNTISTDISYYITLPDDYKLYFGMKVSGVFLNVDFTKLDIYDGDDQGFQKNVNTFSPNIGSGLLLISENGYVGLSIPYMLKSRYYDKESISLVVDKMHYYLIGGYVFNLSDSLKFKPAALTKIVSGAPLQFDLSGNFIYNDKFTLGISYRWDAAFSAMAGFQISPGVLAGYSYDFDTSKLGNYNAGSHELFLRFEVFKNNLLIKNPRFF